MMKQGKVCGYCALCRAKELELYGTIVNKPGAKHTAAVEAAGCRHPAHYLVGGQRNGGGFYGRKPSSN